MKKSIKRLLVALSLLVISTAYGQQSSNGLQGSSISKIKSDCVGDAETIRRLVYNYDILVAQRDNFIRKVQALEADIVNYQQLSIAKDHQIAALEDKIAIDSSTVETYKSTIQTYKDKITDLELQIKEINIAYAKALKKQKRRTTWSQIGGTAIAIGLGYLLITK